MDGRKDGWQEEDEDEAEEDDEDVMEDVTTKPVVILLLALFTIIHIIVNTYCVLCCCYCYNLHILMYCIMSPFCGHINCCLYYSISFSYNLYFVYI